MTGGPVTEATVSAALDDERVDRVVAIAVDVSRAVARTLVEQGDVSLDGVVVTQPSRRVSAGSALRVRHQPEPAAVIRPDADIAVRVVYEDQDIVVVDKPAGLVVHPGSGRPDRTLVNGLLARYPELAGVGEPTRPGIVHRLDAGTTGLLAVARTTVAYDGLVRMLSAREVTRDYRVLCDGVIEPAAGIIDAPIGRSPRDPAAMAVVADGRPARTRYHRIDAAEDVSLLGCRLETGRTHQIRVHLQAHGHPVVGDRRYGGGDRWPTVDRPMLHAAALEVVHPVSGETIRCTSPDPADLDDLRQSLGLDG